MTDFAVVREQFMQAKGACEGIDPDVAIRLLDALEAVEPELLALRDLAANVDEFFGSEAGDLFTPGHDCRCQRRTAQFYREWWKPSAEQRGYRRVQRTYGRGQG